MELSPESNAVIKRAAAGIPLTAIAGNGGDILIETGCFIYEITIETELKQNSVPDAVSRASGIHLPHYSMESDFPLSMKIGMIRSNSL